MFIIVFLLYPCILLQVKVARKTGIFQTWEVICAKEGQKIFLKNLDAKGAINIQKERDSRYNVLVEGQRALYIEKLLRERDITFEKTGMDAVVTFDPLRKTRSPIPYSRSKKAVMRTLPEHAMDWSDYHPLAIVYSFMESLEAHFPSTCSVVNIGKTVEGRDLKMLKISNSDAGNTGVWVDGGIHAREWISISVVTYIANYLARNFDSLPKNITNKDWHFIPIANPDGYHHTHTVDRMWRKNRARFGNTITGVDLNRNYGHYWGRTIPESSSGDPSHLNYRGPEPFSEPETAAMKDIILYSGVPFKIFITFHSYSEVISFPWCYTADPCPDYVNLLEGGTVMAKAIFDTTGRMYKVGNFKDIMYYACGTSIDWSYGTAKIPFTYLVELRSKEDKFLLPREQIHDCCRENLSAILALAKFVDTKKCLNCVVLKKKS